MGLIKTGIALAGAYGLMKAGSKAANEHEDKRNQRYRQQQQPPYTQQPPYEHPGPQGYYGPNPNNPPQSSPYAHYHGYPHGQAYPQGHGQGTGSRAITDYPSHGQNYSPNYSHQQPYPQQPYPSGYQNPPMNYSGHSNYPPPAYEPGPGYNAANKPEKSPAGTAQQYNRDWR
ncbi:hypothetical protein NUU61_009488 [Penicillium alfredii]|uniref:Uncharacterized protein n=1 Tax=Penicillium alfredii TaxID=1506179 RepID=A0A9W9ENG7_9EURO|nr:uncharacterized protein NUU61_009488 [Penicillium alfredii]KAJ5084909.1 hypothetical protein NUU61_009488 [Penicillium alfredii]